MESPVGLHEAQGKQKALKCPRRKKGPSGLQKGCQSCGREQSPRLMEPTGPFVESRCSCGLGRALGTSAVESE